MTRVIYEPERYHLRIEGHAGAGEAGCDPVCAGASALGFTLLTAADETPGYHTHVFADRKAGVLDIQCYPDEELRERCGYLFHVIHEGLRLVEKDAGGYLRIGGVDNG